MKKRMRSSIAIVVTACMTFSLFLMSVSGIERKSADLQEVQRMVELYWPECAEYVDYTNIGHFDQSCSETGSFTTARAEHSIRTRSSSTVYSYSQLCAALADSTVTDVLLGSDITLTDSLEIDHSVSIRSASIVQRRLITSGNWRHFEIEDQGSPTNPIYLDFNNVVLDGDENGGGIHIIDSHVVIENAIMINCYASYGAAINAENVHYNSMTGFLEQLGSVELNNSYIADCQCNNAAISTHGSFNANGCTIEDNACGGLIAVNLSTTVAYINIADTVIQNNCATINGGGLSFITVRATISGSSLIKGNTTTGNSGAGICALACELTTQGSENVNTIIEENGFSVADNVVTYGAGVFIQGKLTMTNTTVRKNWTGSMVGAGAGIFVRTMGSLYSGADESFMISNCIIDQNVCDYYACGMDEEFLNYDPETVYSGLQPFSGGGLYCKDIKGSILSSQITKNHALYGGGIYQEFTSATANPSLLKLTISGCSISENSAVVAGGGINALQVFLSSPNVTSVCSNYAGVVDTTDPTLTLHSQTGKGGGMLIQENGFLSVDSGMYEIKYNIAGNDGGGVYFDLQSACTLSFLISAGTQCFCENYLVYFGYILNNYSIATP